MIKTYSLTVLIGLIMLSFSYGQERTDERKWTIDPEPGIQYILKQSSSLSQRTSPQEQA